MGGLSTKEGSSKGRECDTAKDIPSAFGSAGLSSAAFCFGFRTSILARSNTLTLTLLLEIHSGRAAPLHLVICAMFLRGREPVRIVAENT